MASDIAGRAAALRAWMAETGVSGFMVPRSDRHLGEYVPASDARLAWAAGFNGSAGLAVLTKDAGALLVDGRYTLQAAEETDPDVYSVVPTAKTPTSAWLPTAFAAGDRLAYDPWLHSAQEVEAYEKALGKVDATLTPIEENPIDRLWSDRPAPPASLAEAHAVDLAGRSSADKRAAMAEDLKAERLDAAVTTAPDAVAWALNIRGRDLPHTPVILAMAILRSDGTMQVFCGPEQIPNSLVDADVATAPWDALPAALDALSGARVAVDKAASPAAIADGLTAAGAEVVWRRDPTALPKARKTEAEIQGARAAHLRDGAAMAAALAWIDAEAPGGGLDELAVSNKITEIRAATATRLGSELIDTSFDPIVGYGPNGAIVHYRVSEASSRSIDGDGLLLIDSGGQYRDGTTDITRTIAIGAPSAEERAAFTAVLKGMIAISLLAFPPKTFGHQIDAVSRVALWRAGRNFDHGLGHGVGSFLSVHEGPARLSPRAGDAALEAGMILSNEPGVYVDGRYGVRIENLVLVRPADARSEPDLPGDRPMHDFETLTLAPIDRRLILVDRLGVDERAWLDAYHARVRAEIAPLLDDAEVSAWLAAATEPL